MKLWKSMECPLRGSRMAQDRFCYEIGILGRPSLDVFDFEFNYSTSLYHIRLQSGRPFRIAFVVFVASNLSESNSPRHSMNS